MSFRRIIFWSHLGVGVTAGLIIVLLSITGVLLTYERQILGMSEARLSPAAMSGDQMTADELALMAGEMAGQARLSLVYHGDPARPVELNAGRGRTTLINPYSGETIESAAGPTRDFFRAVTSLHRYLAMSGESRATGKAITGAANLAFLFILISGFYLWWPRAWRWSFVKLNLFFRDNLPSAKARDYNWHHVFGIWALVPLLAVVISGVVISYPWAASLVERAYGDGPAALAGPADSGDADAAGQAMPETVANLQGMLDAARAVDANWRTIAIALPATPQTPLVELTIDTGNGAQYDRKRLLTFDHRDGSLLTDVMTAQTQTPARRARIYLRFLHTGEVYGWWGQTLAGLGSLAALFLAWTGLALAWRRLVLPAWRRRRQ
ncbi:PepSY-associated TM helix domain-containing protein [Maricaulis salignorans]|uniref:PepSY-associated TM helix domain-containing protein n=1 Tax=Maricaulis salignorans TaxID=144026 RepID=UPI003A91FB17